MGPLGDKLGFDLGEPDLGGDRELSPEGVTWAFEVKLDRVGLDVCRKLADRLIRWA